MTTTRAEKVLLRAITRVRPRSTWAAAMCLAAVVAAGLCGCVVEDVAPARNRLFGTHEAIRAPRSGEDILRTDPQTQATVQTRTAGLRTELIPIGEINYDLLTFPMVSPDGRYIVSETGISPGIETLIADADATVPSPTTISVYEMLPADAEHPKARVELLYALDEAWLLGRSCNEHGFLIEAPQPDRSRWIGFVSWENGEVTWIVQDSFVNAFAALGSAGRLAWSRRDRDAKHFELVVVIAGEQFTLAEELTSWVYPTFTRDGEGLFSVRIDREERLIAQFMRGDARATMLASRQEIILSNKASVRGAYAMHAASPAVQGLPPRAQPALVFYHPEFLAVGVWRPLHAGEGAAKLLDAGSVAGIMDADEYIIFSLRNEMVGQPLADKHSRVLIARVTYVPHLTVSEHWRYVLIARDPHRSGVLQITGMNLSSPQE